MHGYDWDFGFGFGQRHEAHRGYDAAFRRRGYDRAPAGGARHRRGGGWRSQDLGRGVYGEDYPTYGGVPGGRRQGMYYGGIQRGYGDVSRGPQGGNAIRDRQLRGERPDYGFGRGYDQRFEREPFIPEAAYRRHAEFARPQLHRRDRWPDRGHALPQAGLDDEELRQAVRQSLYQDDFIDADSIDVEVADGVVTLTGEVGDYLEARYAWDDAWETEGVHGVINHLTVRIDRPAGEHQAVLQTEGRSGSEDRSQS